MPSNLLMSKVNLHYIHVLTDEHQHDNRVGGPARVSRYRGRGRPRASRGGRGRWGRGVNQRSYFEEDYDMGEDQESISGGQGRRL